MEKRITKRVTTPGGTVVRYYSDDGVLWIVRDAEHGDPIAHVSLSMAGYPTVVPVKGKWRPFRAATVEEGAVRAVQNQERWKRDVLAKVADNGRYFRSRTPLGYARGPYGSGSVAHG